MERKFKIITFININTSYIINNIITFLLNFFPGNDSKYYIHTGPFIYAFIWFIFIPLLLAGLMQSWPNRNTIGKHIKTGLSILPMPATTLVLFIVVAAMMPQLETAADAVVQVIPVYITFAVIAPIPEWMAARLFNLDASTRRSIAFSSATHNSLVVLPLALSVPNAIPIFPLS